VLGGFFLAKKALEDNSFEAQQTCNHHREYQLPQASQGLGQLIYGGTKQCGLSALL
jgi:hypothetical protein